MSCPCYIFDGVVTLSHAHRFIKLKWEDERARQCGCPPYMKGDSHSTLNTLSLVIYALDESIPECLLSLPVSQLVLEKHVTGDVMLLCYHSLSGECTRGWSRGRRVWNPPCSNGEESCTQLVSTPRGNTVVVSRIPFLGR